VAVPHDPAIHEEKVSKDVYEVVIRPSLKKFGFSIGYRSTICNGTGKWEIGGPASDTGVTGRKVAVDTYGSMARVGGGCFSGKDPSKVDRSGAYMARYVAKNIVAAGLAERCEVQVAYVIGKAEPTSIHVDTFGTGKVSDDKLIEAIKQVFDLEQRIDYAFLNAGIHYIANIEDTSLEKIDEIINTNLKIKPTSIIGSFQKMGHQLHMN